MNRLIKTLGVVVPVLLAGINPVSAQTFDIVSAGDFGNSRSNPPANAVDGNTRFGSRWSATFDGGSANLFVDLGSRKTIDNVGIAWGRGSKRSYRFQIRARSGTRGKWTTIFSGRSSGNTGRIENYNVEDIRARQVRVRVTSNSAGTNWAIIKEFEVYGTNGRRGGNSGTTSTPTRTPAPAPAPAPTGNFGLSANAEPWENFDLREWKIDTPAGESSASDCAAQSTEPQDWNDSFLRSRSNEFFFTHSDGGMRFIAEYGGGTTGSPDCRDKSRSELREMLRGSNTSIDTTGKNGDFRNNWALDYQPSNADANRGESWGARGGRMRATLRINDVTESGSRNDQGNIVIGQIHASSDEPLRLHYRHRPGFANGCIWAASEIRDGDDVNFNIIGTRDCSSSPGNGIALNELFSYEIENSGADIIVTIRNGDRGSVIAREVIELDRLNSGYDRDDEWHYFKAGVYSQNDDGQIGDRDIATFYRLDVDH